ncbi:MAG: N-acetylneuraminate synthase [Siculibacillus sp.]|nr:N-acetylneuraminate synthase [Siculibacillus sp.]
MEPSTRVIAEAGVNHNGDIALAERLVAEAVSAGADIVKFQTFRAADLATAAAATSAYQRRNTGEVVAQTEMLRRLELSDDAHRHLARQCEASGIEFLSTPFDLRSAEFLVSDIGIRRIKVSSGDLTNGPFLLALARLGLPMILSTGMATLGEVEEAVGVFAFARVAGADATPSRTAFSEALGSPEGRAAVAESLTLLHCTTEYPASFASVNLRAMDSLAVFSTPIGLSDHTEGWTVPIAAVARGATVVEKHFTLDRTLTGPDHRASLEPGELKAMVDALRIVEVALGSRVKAPHPSERPNMAVARKSLVARRPIAAGEPFDAANLGAKRPGTGLSPMAWWSMLGRPANRPYAADEIIDS